MKRLVSVFVCVILSLSCLSVGANAANVEKKYCGDLSEAFKYEVLDDGTVEITDYFDIFSELTIPETIDGYTVSSIGYCAFEDCKELTTVVIPGTVKKIHSEAFFYCTSLKSVELKNGVETISGEAFYFCKQLKKINIPASIEDLESTSFTGCINLESIEVDPKNEKYSSLEGVLYDKNFECLITYPSGKSEIAFTVPDSVLYIYRQAFDYCKNLLSVTLGCNVEEIHGYAFIGCDKLRDITISSSVEEIGSRAFANCANLLAINVNADNSEYTSVDGVLFNKDKTALIKYPSGKEGAKYEIPESVTYVDECAFDYCQSIEEIVFGSNVQTLGSDSFEHCYSLKTIIMNDGLEMIGNGAFERCDSLCAVSIPDSVKIINGYAFAYCDKLSEINIGDNVIDLSFYSFYATAYYNNDSNWVDDVLYIGNYLIRAKKTIEDNYKVKDGTVYIVGGAFIGCSNIKNITLPKSIKKIGSSAFDDKSLSNVYYLGSEKEWEQVDVEDWDIIWCAFKNANFYFEEAEPATEKPETTDSTVEPVTEKPEETFPTAEPVSEENPFATTEPVTEGQEVTNPTAESVTEESEITDSTGADSSEQQTNSTEATEPTFDETSIEETTDKPVAAIETTVSSGDTQIFKYLPSKEQLESGNTIKLVVKDTDGQYYTVEMTATPEIYDGASVYTATLPADITPELVQFQIYHDGDWKSQVSLTAEQYISLKGALITSEGKAYGGEQQTTAQPKPSQQTVSSDKAKNTVTVTAKKSANTIKVKVKKKTVSARKLKKRKITVKALYVTNAKGKVTYSKEFSDSALKVNKTTGKITVKKGTKKGTYSTYVIIKAKGNSKYKSKKISKLVIVKVK